jgi:hypothetical protein
VLVSLNEETGRMRLAPVVARSLGIPTVFVQHGMCARHPKYRRPVSDRLCVWGEADGETLRALGCEPGRIVVTGPPGFDGLRADPPPPEARRRVLVTAVSGSGETSEAHVRRVLDYVLEGLSRLPDVDVRVRPHPGDRLGVAAQVAARHRVEIRGGEPLAAGLSWAGIVVSMASTSGFEAILAGRPLVFADPLGADALVSYAREGAALPGGSAEEVAASVSAILDREATREGLEAGQREYRGRHAAGLDGHAAARVAAVIRDAAAPRAAGHHGGQGGGQHGELGGQLGGQGGC